MHVARDAIGIDPRSGVDAGERVAKRRGELTEADAQRTGQATIHLNIQLWLLSARGEPDVDGAGRDSHRISDGFSQLGECVCVGPLKL